MIMKKGSSRKGSRRKDKSFAEVRRLVRDGYTVVPLVREFVADVLTPVVAYFRLAKAGDGAFLLESVEGGERIGRYSFIGIRPFAQIVVRNGQAVFEGREGEPDPLSGNPFTAIGKRLEAYRAYHEEGLPRLASGAVGYLGYEMTRHLEPKTELAPPRGIEAQFMLFDRVVAFDRLQQRLLLVSSIISKGTNQRTLREHYAAAIAALDEMEERLCTPAAAEGHMLLHRLDGSSGRAGGAALGRGSKGKAAPRPRLGQEAFEAGVRTLKRHIRAGDIFQAVLSERFTVPLRSDPFSVYRALRTINPSPYMFYLDLGPTRVALGASPEMLVRVEDGLVETRPIAGTRPRGRDEAEDRRHEKNLVSSVKECAEHIMLVDLGRNDVGRVARPGTVEVASLKGIERYSHVMHMVSSVQGKLRRDRTAWEALGACFPAGTLTGAPKIRAIQLVGSLEPVARGVYGGAIVSYDFRGLLDSAIAIRSMMAQRKESGSPEWTKGEAHVQAGAGIVFDSKPSREWEEVQNKARAVLEAIRLAGTVKRSDVK